MIISKPRRQALHFPALTLLTLRQSWCNICTYNRRTQRTNYFFLCTFKGTRIIFAQAISIPLYRFANFVLGIRASETMKWSLHFPRHCKRMQFAIFKKTLLIWSFSGLHSCCTPVWIDQEPFVEMLHSDNTQLWVDLRLTFNQIFFWYSPTIETCWILKPIDRVFGYIWLLYA